MTEKPNIKYQGYLRIEEQFVMTDSGNVVSREVLTPKNAVAALVYDTLKKKFIFVNQFRCGSNSDILEVVAGTLDKPNEDKEDAINREIFEEIGYETDHIEMISEFFVSPGISSEKISLFYCEVSKKTGQGGGLESENEDIDIVEFSYDEMLSENFMDAKTIIAINWLVKKSSIYLRYEH